MEKQEHILNPEQFMEEVKKRVDKTKAGESSLTLISLDFDNFNYINDLYSYETGDRVLERISIRIDSALSEDDIFCRHHADNFLICLHIGDPVLATQVFTGVTDLKQTLSGLLSQHYTLVASGGILVVQNNSVPLSALLDRANCARKLSKGNISSSFHIYDKKMDEEAQWKQQVTCMMESALSNGEFEMHFQPKVIFKTGEIMGAEALVRWQSAEYGMIYPDRFIPILEQNGFVRRLDFFMLEEACRFLNECRANGYPLLPISVNFSKIHLRTDRLVERIFETVNRQEIPTSMIEIEFTETILSESTERLIETVSDLRMLGFHVALDDFGSAYSSLNYLKDLPIDIVKVDKGFLDSFSDTDRGKVVIAKMVELIKSLRMMSVIEGVETEEQVEFLKKLSCDIGQGYFYAKPMTWEAYISYLEKGAVLQELRDGRGAVKADQTDQSYLNIIPQEFQMDNWELYTLGKNIDMGLMKGYLDGEATVQYVNDRALEYLGYTRQEFREIFHNSIAAFTHWEDAHIVQKNTEQLIADNKPRQFQARAVRKDGKVIILKGTSACVIDERGRPIGIYAFQDVTEELERTASLQMSLENKINELEEMIAAEQKSRESLRQSEERYRIVVEQSGAFLLEWDFAEDDITFSEQYWVLVGRAPRELKNASQNPAFRKFIHPEDMQIFEDWIASTFRKTGRSESTFRIADAAGKYIRLALCSTAICGQNGVPIKAVGTMQCI